MDVAHSGFWKLAAVTMDAMTYLRTSLLILLFHLGGGLTIGVRLSMSTHNVDFTGTPTIREAVVLDSTTRGSRASRSAPCVSYPINHLHIAQDECVIEKRRQPP